MSPIRTLKKRVKENKIQTKISNKMKAKASYFLVIVMLLTLSGYSQELLFSKVDFETALKKAREETKYIFIDDFNTRRCTERNFFRYPFPASLLCNYFID